MDERLTSAVTAAGGSIGNNLDVEAAKARILAGEDLARRAAQPVSQDVQQPVFGELRDMRETLVKNYVRKASAEDDVALQVLSVLKSGSISSGRSGFPDARVFAEMTERIAKLTAAGQPLTFAMLMGGGKIANPLKTGDQILPDLAEWHSWSMLSAIGDAIDALYPPGALIVAIPDAAWHTADLGVPIEESIAHQRMVEQDMQRLNVANVKVPNTLPFMDEAWAVGVQALARDAKQRFQNDSAFREDVREQVNSLVYSLNTRVATKSYEDLALTYAAIAGHLHGIDGEHRLAAAELFRQAETVACHYIGVNWAIRRFGAVERVVKAITGDGQYFRLSVHAKPGEPRPKLFEPSSLFPAATGLLPMHGVGIVADHQGKRRFGATFELTARVRGFIPVVDGESGRFLWYEASANGETIA